MKKWQGLQSERDTFNDTLCEVGAVLSERFHNRAKELLVEFSKFKGVKVTYLKMGMGGWWIGGEVPFKEVWKDQVEEGTHDIDLYDFQDKRQWNAFYEEVNPGICAVATELLEILQFLTDEHYVQLLEIPEKEMKKLLSKA